MYVDNCHSDEITIKQALGQVVQLNAETEKQIEQAKYEVSAKQQEQRRKQTSVQGIMNRGQIIENARIISQKSQRGYVSSPEMEDDQLNIKNGGE